jgi:hypothetical protein
LICFKSDKVDNKDIEEQFLFKLFSNVLKSQQLVRVLADSTSATFENFNLFPKRFRIKVNEKWKKGTTIINNLKIYVLILSIVFTNNKLLSSEGFIIILIIYII